MSFFDEDREQDDEEMEVAVCDHPGPHGCGHCAACMAWGDDEYSARKEEGR